MNKLNLMNLINKYLYFFIYFFKRMCFFMLFLTATTAADLMSSVASAVSEASSTIMSGLSLIVPAALIAGGAIAAIRVTWSVAKGFFR